MATSTQLPAPDPHGPAVIPDEDRAAAVCAVDPQAARALPAPAVTAAVRRPGASLSEVIATIMTGYADRPAAAERAREAVTDPATGRTSLRLLPRFDTVSYAELWSRARAVMSDWYHDPEAPVAAGDAVAVLGFASVDYLTVDLACLALGAVEVPLTSNATAAQLAPIIAETAPRLLAAGMEQLDTALACATASGSIRRVVVFDHDARDDDQRERLQAARDRLAGAGVHLSVDPLADVVERGRVLPPAPPYTPAPGEDPLRLLLYTSGSTGAPKGAMHVESIVRAQWRGGYQPQPEYLPHLAICFMPLSHGAGRAVVARALASGGTCSFTARSDLSTFFEDIALARPTELMLVPRVCDMLFQRYHSELDRRVAAGEDPAAAGEAVCAAIHTGVLGGRVIRATVGSAPMSAEMAAFMESCLGVRLHNNYGSTEAGLPIVDGRVQRPPVVDYRLVDVPELGYHATDLPYPRGELLLRSESLIPGYYRRPDVTAAVFDADGYYRTGDIMAEIGPDHLVYVDRRNNVLKLSQGEFVAVARLEAIFATSPLVRQIFVYGNSERAYLLAVVVPTAEALAGAATGTATGTATGGTAQGLAARILDSLQRIARDNDLNAYEVPRDVIVETEPFTTANGLLSDLRKPLRPRLKERYGARLEQRYAQLAEREAAELSELRQGGRDQPVLPALRRAAQALLSCSSAEISPRSHFADLGGDSLSALTYANLLREIFGVEVPVRVIISPATDLRALASYVESAVAAATGRADGARRPTFAAVHGADATVVRAADLTLDRFVDPTTLAAAGDLPVASWTPRAGTSEAGGPRTVLLTGANGYLGRFLCLEWLRRLAPTGGRLVCLVRGATHDDAARRLAAAFDSGDPALRSAFEELAGDGLEVLAGDLAEPSLGLGAATWHRLASTVDLIVHPAAMVNHVLPYEQLFGPNVVGTAELVRLALTERRKPFAYLSSVAVLWAATDPGEDEDIRATCPHRCLDGGHAGGYATSKWAGEVLLREAHERYGLPVLCLRSDMILAHRRYAGQLNVPDMFTRLLLSVVATGLAPRSFYRTDEAGGRPDAHYDGLPVDFTAEVVAELASRTTGGHRTVNMLNPHEDGVSLDVIVDWLVAAGHRIHRVDDFGAWRDQLAAALRGLPDRQRQYSLLALPGAFAAPAEPVTGATAPTDRFRAAVREAKLGHDGEVPHVTGDLILKYVADLRHLGLL